MYCPNCGKELSEGASFCGFCGAAPRTPGISKPSNPGVTHSVTDTTPAHKASKTLLIAATIVVIAAVICVVSLYSGRSKTLSGTYQSIGLISQTFSFDGNHVTMSAFGINASGTYEIKNSQISITYTLFGNEYTWTQLFSQDGDSIFISGMEFVKQ